MGRFIDITGAPIASDFQEMPLDFMSKALDVKQKSLDTFRSDADKGLPVDVGLRTEWVKKYADETYAPELDRIVKNAVANPQGASRELTSLRTKMAKDPFIAKAKLDAAARDFVTKNEYTLKQAGKPVYGYRDAQGNVMQMSKEDLLNKDFDLGTWYKSMGFSDYIKPGMEYLDKAPDIKKMLQSDKGLTLTALGQIPFYRTGKGVSNIHKQTIENMLPTITMLENMYLDNPSAFAQRWRVDQGIEDLDGNQLVNDVEARNKATNFITELAKTKVFDNTSTVTDYDYAQLATPKGGSGDGDDKSGGAVLNPLGTVDTEYAKNRVDLLKKTDYKTIINDAAKKWTAAIIDRNNANLIKTTDTKFWPLYKSVLNKDGYIDPDKLMKADLSKFIDAAGNNASMVQTLQGLQVAQADYNTLKEVDDLSDYNARKRSGYSDSKYKALDAYKNILHKKGEYLIDGDYIINVMDDGTVVQQRTSLLGDPVGVPTLLEKAIPKKDVALAQAYFKDVVTNKKLQNYEKIKKEEADRLLPDVVNAQAKTETITFDKKADREVFDDLVMKAITAASGSKEGSNTFSTYGKADDVSLPDNADLSSIKTIGHYKNNNGYATVFTVDVPTGSGSKVSRTFTFNKSPKAITDVIDNLKGNTNVVLADVQKQISENASEAPPKGYIKPIRVNNKLVATQKVDDSNNVIFNLEPDAIETYNKKVEYLNKTQGTSYKTIKESDSFTIDDLPTYVTLIMAPVRDSNGKVQIR